MIFVSPHSARTRSCAHDGCISSNCCESINKHKSNPAYNIEEHNQVTNDIANNFSESCRIDNLKSIENSTQFNFYGMRSALHHPQALSMQTPSTRSSSNYMHGNCASTANQTALIDNNRENNSHAKLRRQLSLNPNAFDPRLNRRQNSNLHPQLIQSEQQMHQQSQHRLLGPSFSSPRSQHISNPWDLHQVKEKYSLRNQNKIIPIKCSLF